MSVQAGQRLGGRYQLVERVAIGGMGEVWRAHDDVLGRDVAVKAINASYAEDRSFLERFRAEARHTAALSHPGIANVYDYGEEGGTAYLVMELVDGEPLSALLDREGRLPAGTTMDIVGQAAMALQAAHDAGMVHRDVKPGNLIVRPDGVVKITDFGIARAADAVPLTITGQVMGTAQYLSPEQASGESVSASSDLYSLGVVGFECLAGARPFDGDNPVSVGLAHVHEPPPVLPADVPEPARELIARCLAKDPARRFASASELARSAFAVRNRVGDAAASTLPIDRTKTVAIGEGAIAAGAGHGSQPPTRAYTQAAPRGEPASRRNQRSQRRVRNSLLAVGAAVIALAIALALLARGCGAKPSVTVPRVTGVSVDQATATLHGQGLRADVHREHDPSKPSGIVLKQDPGVHAQVAQGSTVTLTVSSGKKLISVDASDYRGRSYDEVRGDLTNLGLRVSRAKQVAPGTAPGTVVAVNPHGQVPKGTTITVTVAVAPPPPAGNNGNGNNGEGNGNEGKHKGEHNGNGEGNSGSPTPSTPTKPSPTAPSPSGPPSNSGPPDQQGRQP